MMDYPRPTQNTHVKGKSIYYSNNHILGVNRQEIIEIFDELALAAEKIEMSNTKN